MNSAMNDMIIGTMHETSLSDIETSKTRFLQVRHAVYKAGYTICDLKPLAAKFKNCDPDIDSITECVENGQLRGRTMLTQVAQALNWERTEFDTLDELLAELREHEQERSVFSSVAVRDQERLAACYAALEYYADQSVYQDGDVPGHVYVLDDNGSTAQVCLMNHGGGPSIAATTHAVLHGTEYYPDSAILLQTAQLVAWRDADGQEHCERAHRVTLNPDRDGLAAAILSGIAGAQIAPEHIAELRAQMGGVL